MKFHNRLAFKISLTLSLVVMTLLFFTAWRIINKQSSIAEEMLIQKGSTAALTGAAAYGAILDIGVDTGEVALDELLNPRYEQIPYPFAIEHPRYHTKFDSYTDAHVAELQDAALNSSPDFIYASGMDHLGYVPTAHARYAEEPRGDFAWDLEHARRKRKYQEPVQQSAAGFRRSILQPVLVQEYHRNTGNTWDIAAEILVKGKHFGAFRVGLRFDRIEDYRLAFVAQLGAWFGLSVLVVVLVIFGVVSLAMRPLNKLTKVALALANGDHLDVPILPLSDDEVGSITNAVNELRRGMMAMYKNQQSLRAKLESTGGR